MDLKSGQPFWTTRSGLIRNYPPLTHDERCDAVVIGGGITGALVAFHLAEAGIDTIVLDKRDIARGSTSVTTALLQYEIDTPLHELVDMVGEDHAARSYLACRDGIDKIEALLLKINDNCEFTRKKSLYLASKQSDVKKLQKEWEIRKRYGFHLDWLSRSDIANQFSFERPAALMSYDGAEIDAYRFAHALLNSAGQMGTRIYDRTEVTDIQYSPRSVTVKTDRGCSVRAKKVVFAAGYESQIYLKQKVAKLISTYALASEPVDSFDGWPDRCLIWESAHPYLYMRTTGDNRVIVGGEDDDFQDPARRDRQVIRKAGRLKTKFDKLFPQMEMEVAYCWAGTFGETKDGLAYIGESPELYNAYFALGYGGNGITYSVLAAEIIRDAMRQRANPYADLFRFDR